MNSTILAAKCVIRSPARVPDSIRAATLRAAYDSSRRNKFVRPFLSDLVGRYPTKGGIDITSFGFSEAF